jgi:hypothetical protein
VFSTDSIGNPNKYVAVQLRADRGKVADKAPNKPKKHSP